MASTVSSWLLSAPQAYSHHCIHGKLEAAECMAGPLPVCRHGSCSPGRWGRPWTPWVPGDGFGSCQSGWRTCGIRSSGPRWCPSSLASRSAGVAQKSASVTISDRAVPKVLCVNLTAYTFTQGAAFTLTTCWMVLALEGLSQSLYTESVNCLCWNISEHPFCSLR